MIIIRPVKHADIEQLHKLAKKVAPGITTFPPDMDVLNQKIAASQAAFKESTSVASSSSYLMVMEDTESQLIMGTAAVYSNIGQVIPFYTFKILSRIQHSSDLEIKVNSNTLNLVNEYTGDTEIGTLVLDPEYRGGGHGKLLGKCRYMLLAQFKERFGERVFAELRGWSDTDSVSPFWESVGKCFFGGMSYERADYLSATTNNQFIADLMPKYPIYIELLPKAVQAVIGVPHATGEPALKMLFNEGFLYDNYVDIFDAGPTVHVQGSQIATVKNSKLHKLGNITSSSTGANYLVCNTSLEKFRVCQTEVTIDQNNAIGLPKNIAKQLLVEPGDYLRIYPLKSKR